MAILMPVVATKHTGMYDLPVELLEQIVVAAISEPEPVKITHIDEEVDRLVAPFKCVSGLLQIAKREVMRANTFLVSFEHDAGVDPGYERLEGKDGGAEFKLYLDLENGETVSSTCKEARHLLIDTPIDLNGGDWDEWWYPQETFRMDQEFFHHLPLLFPQLRSLDVRVNNVGNLNPDLDDLSYTENGAVIDNPEDARFRLCVRCEKALAVQRLLLLIAAAPIPESIKTTVTFTQNPLHGSRNYPTVEFGTFSSVKTYASALEWAPSHNKLTGRLLVARAALLLDRMRGTTGCHVDRQLVRNPDLEDEIEFQELLHSDVSASDQEVVEGMLDSAQAVVTLPDGVVRVTGSGRVPPDTGHGVEQQSGSGARPGASRRGHSSVAHQDVS